jgi:hypothetical protein
MNRTLGLASWSCSLFAAACLVLGVCAVPGGLVRAEEPPDPWDATNCGGNSANGCTWDEEDCDLACPTIPGNNLCKCKWYRNAQQNGPCGCWPNVP